MEQTPVNIIVADDQQIFRYGLITMLARDPGFKVVAEAANGIELVKKSQELQPQVALVDIRMPLMDGIEAIAKLNELQHPPRCIALSTYDSEILVVDAMNAGASGYIIKTADRGEIAEAIRWVHSGSVYYCKSTSVKVAKLLVKNPSNPNSKIPAGIFTEREKEIIRLICEGKTSPEISKELCIGQRTIESERVKILEKMNVRTVAELVIYAIRNFMYVID